LLEHCHFHSDLGLGREGGLLVLMTRQLMIRQTAHLKRLAAVFPPPVGTKILARASLGACTD